MKKLREIITYALLFVFIAMHFVMAKNPTPSVGKNPGLPRDLKGAKTAVCIGPGVLQLYSYVCGSDGIVGVEEDIKNSRDPYLLAYPELKEKEVISLNKEVDPKKIQDLNPDLVFISKAYTPAQIKQLRAKVSMPIIELSYGREEIFGRETLDSILEIGRAMGRDKRAQTLVEGLKKEKSTLLELVNGKAPGPKTYIGGTSPIGSPSFLSTCHGLEAYDLLGLTNPQRDQSNRTYQRLTRKQLLDMGPEVIFVDSQVLYSLEKDQEIYEDIYKNIPAFKNKRVYVMGPYRHKKANMEMAILDIYYMGQVTYGKDFSQIKLEEKARDLSQLFFNKDISKELLTTHPEAFHEI